MKNLLIIICTFFILLPEQGISQNVRLLNQKGNSLEFGMQFDGLKRQFIVHLPSTYKTQTQQNFPVVFMLHGGGGSGRKYYNISGWKELGEQEGIITVFPTGYKTCIEQKGKSETKTFWLTTNKSANLCYGEKDRSDAAFLRAIVDYLKQNYRTDASRYYCTGFSNGMGFTLSRTIPELGDIFAAVGGSGSILAEQMSQPAAIPLPCFVMIGERDSRLTQHNNNQAFPTTGQGIANDPFLKERIEILTHLLSLEMDYTVRERPKHTTLRFQKTKDGGDHLLQFSVLKGLGHIYPRGIPDHNGIQGAKVFWDFFQQYQK